VSSLAVDIRHCRSLSEWDGCNIILLQQLLGIVCQILTISLLEHETLAFTRQVCDCCTASIQDWSSEKSETMQHRAWRKGVQDAGIDACAGTQRYVTNNDILD